MARVQSSSRSSVRFQVGLLGPFTLLRDGKPLDVARWRPRVARLFRLLVTAPGRRRSRDELIALLWPEAAPEAGLRNLRFLLHMLRKELGNGARVEEPVLVEHGWVTLNPAYEWEVDLDRFEELAASAGSSIDRLEQAIGLYRGEPLPDDRYEDWATPVRERLQRTRRDVCLRLAEAHRAAGNRDAGLRWYEEVMLADPLDDEALRGMLQALTDLGRRSEALRRYSRFKTRLRQELDLEPQAETEALVEALKSPLPQAPRQQETSNRVMRAVPRYPLPTGVPLVGREAELTAVLDLIVGPERTLEEEGPAVRLVVLEGAAGMGKTRMLGEIAQRAQAAGALVLAGGCYEQEGALPYGPIHDALLDYVMAQPDIVLRIQLDDLLPELARLIPGLRSRLSGIPEPSAGDEESRRLRLFTTVAQALERLAAESPLVVLLDDLHCTDEATLQLLHFLLRQSGLGRTLLVGTYRQEEVTSDSMLAQLVAEMTDAGRARVLILQPLSDAELATLVEERLGGRCSDRLVRSLWERSQGNPFFALQIVRLLQQEGRLAQTSTGWEMAGDAIELPPKVRETVARRLHHLDPEAQEVLTLGAVLGPEFDASALAAMWDGAERTLFAALDVALGAYLLRETEQGYAFLHPLLWEVVEGGIPAHRRKRLHEEAGQILERIYGQAGGEDTVRQHAAELAWHFTEGRDTTRALRYTMLAGDQAEEVFAHADAERHYRMARKLAGDVGDRSREAETLSKLGTVLTLEVRYDEARDTLEQAAEIYRKAQDLEGLAHVTADIAHVYEIAGWTSVEALERLRTLLKTLEASPPSPALAKLHTRLAGLLYMGGRYSEQLEAAERGIGLASAVGQDATLLEAERHRLLALFLLGRLDEALHASLAALPRAEAAGDLDNLCELLGGLGVVYLHLGKPQEGRPYAQRAVELAERLGDPWQICVWSGALGLYVFITGDWQEARRHFELALELGEHSRLPFAMWQIGWLELAEGLWDQAAETLERSMVIPRQIGNLQAIRWASGLLAELDLLQGRPVAARDRVLPLLDRPGLQELDVTFLLVRLAWAHLELDETAQARSLADEAVRRARVQHYHLALADALRVQGVVVARDGCWEEAQRDLEDATALCRETPYPYAEARALYEWGKTESAMGVREKAYALLNEALTIFRRLGAQPYVEWTQQELANLRRA